MLPQHPSGGEREMSFWSSNPPLVHLSCLPLWLRQTSVEGQMVCVTLVLLLCDCYLYTTEVVAAAAAGPQDKSFCFGAWRGEKARNMSRRQKQMSRLDYHLSPSGRTRPSCLVCVRLASVGVWPPLPAAENSSFDISISPVLALEK